MKVMHNPPLNVRLKFEEYLEKDGKELVNFAYGTSNMDERRFYVGIAYMPTHSDTDGNVDNIYSPNRYDVITYGIEKDIFACDYQHLNYENALFYMSKSITKTTYENK